MKQEAQAMSDATDDTAQLIPANDSAFYRLATAWGEQPEGATWSRHDEERADKNRQLWNRWWWDWLQHNPCALGDKERQEVEKHLPPQDREPLSTKEQQALEDRLGPDLKLPAGPIEAIDWNRHTFDRFVTFTAYSFMVPLMCEQCRWEHDVGFTKVRFCGYAGFCGASFSGDAWFNDASFSGNTKFTRASFSGDAEFNHVRFGGDAWFNDASVTGTTWFKGARFSGDAWFNDASFSGIAGFTDVRFCGEEVEFTRTSFRKNAWFNDAKFSGNAKFTCADFCAKTVFFNANFYLKKTPHETNSSAVNFGESRFKGEADFAMAVFSEDVYVNFDTAIFDGFANFQHTKFMGGVNFKRATFKDLGTFFFTKFTKNSSFANARFEGGVDFTEARFKKDKKGTGVAEFKFMHVSFDAAFKQAEFGTQACFNRAKFDGALNLCNAAFKEAFEANQIQVKGAVNFSFDPSEAQSETQPSACNTQAVDFENATFEAGLDMRGRRFSEVPQFQGASINANFAIDAEDAAWPVVQAKAANLRNLENQHDSYEHLRQQMGSTGRRGLELFFLRKEYQAQMVVLAKQRRWEAWPKSWLLRGYGWVSNFGQSILRPLAALIIVMIYSAWGYCALLQNTHITDVRGFSIEAQASPDERFHLALHLAGSGAASVLPPPIFTVAPGQHTKRLLLLGLHGGQRLLSALLWFLIGLGVRNTLRLP